ncbi:MAG: family 43 glycosylhydrolase [Clostridia bacterium]|nr:family 43 glycosylhydrolase [Clostridia bacterium]
MIMRKPYVIDESANLTTCRDPMVLVVGDTYYLTGTQPPYWTGVNDGVHLWSSKDLKHFTDHGLIVRRDAMPEDMWCRDRFWAPELFDAKNGWFYLTFNCRNESEQYKHPHITSVARSRNITGPYEIIPYGQLSFSDFNYTGRSNDASMFRDDDGALYLAANFDQTESEPLVIARVDEETLSFCELIRVCGLGRDGEWDHIGIEGPCIVKRHGIYFQWYSSWTDGYNAGILTAPGIRGPWTKHPDNPILNPNDIWYQCGHNHSFVGLDGKDYIVFHAFMKDPSEEKIERIFIRRVDYLPDGSVKIFENLGYGEELF